MTTSFIEKHGAGCGGPEQPLRLLRLLLAQDLHPGVRIGLGGYRGGPVVNPEPDNNQSNGMQSATTARRDPAG